MKRRILIFVLLFVISFVSFPMWEDVEAEVQTDIYQEKILFKDEYHNQFIEYEYDDRPTLKIEKYFEPFGELESIKSKYESLTDIIPSHILLKLKEKKLVVHYVNEIMDYWWFHTSYSVLGFFNASTYEIFVDIESIDTVTYHEIGHAVSDAYGRLDKTKDFRNALDEDNVPINKSDTPSELFADFFLTYISSLEYDERHIVNYYVRASLMNDYPHVAEYFKNALDLPAVYDGYAYRRLLNAKFSFLKRLRYTQKIERVSGNTVSNMKIPFVIDKALSDWFSNAKILIQH